MRIAVCQINTTVGDLPGNLDKISEACDIAVACGADLALFPELTVVGYPPEDLLLRPRFVADCKRAIIDDTPKLPLPALVGFPLEEYGELFNACALLEDGEVKALYRKVLLPNYSVFDEKRYFTPGARGLVVECAGRRLGVVICEDAWSDTGPALDEAAAGADTILCLSASPFHKGKHSQRESVFAALCKKCGTDFVYCNLVGGQDELVFDGGSFLMDNLGKVLFRGAEFAEDIFCIDLPECARKAAPKVEGRTALPVDIVNIKAAVTGKPALAHESAEKLSALAEIYQCLCLGVRDYVRKNGFSRVVLGLSGGIDSALAAAVAVDALGAENVTGVTMPSHYSSSATRGDAEALADNLGIQFLTVPVKPVYDSVLGELSPFFEGRKADLTEENLQARIRAVYLMALSNKFGWLVLNTSNKSESAVGYGTMYGDMIGAYSVLKDVFKTTVFELSWFVNELHGREVIPESTITRPPSAELRPDQKDSDSLPEYDVLDPVLQAYIEEDCGIDELLSCGFDPEVVRRAVSMTDRNEWKRRQSVPGVRITQKAFGKDRRMPLTNRYRG